MGFPKLSVKDRLNLILYDFITEQFTSSDNQEFCTICRQENFYIDAGIFSVENTLFMLTTIEQVKNIC